MDERSSDLLEGIDPESVSPGDVDESEIEAALNSAIPLVKQRGVVVCQSLAESDPDAVAPFLDEIGSIVTDENFAIAMRAIGVLETVGTEDPDAIVEQLGDLAEAVDTDHVDIQITGAALFGQLVVDRPDICAPHARALIDAIRNNEISQEMPDFSDVVEDEVTRQTLQEHEEGERQRRLSSRQLLINVVVAIAEQEPESITDTVEPLVDLLDDTDPHIIGGAIDAIREIGAVDREAVVPAEDRLIECLDHFAEFVRARAINAIGVLEIEAAVPELREMAESEENEDVREIAADTADFLDE